MAENARVRIEPHIEAYLKTHAQRILDKPSDSKFTVAELAIITNQLLMEHKQANKFLAGVAQKIPLANLFNWLSSLGSGNSKVVQIVPPVESSALSPAKEDFDFDADFAAQFEKENAA